MLDFKLEKLSNGLKVITAPLKNTKAVSVLIMIQTGSRYETAQNNGIYASVLKMHHHFCTTVIGKRKMTDAMLHPTIRQ